MSQNLDRRAFELFNAIGVVPGAIGAWRRRALVEAGGYSHDTLAEDADLTITIERNGWRVLGEPAAIALTEAPESLRIRGELTAAVSRSATEAVGSHGSRLISPRLG